MFRLTSATGLPLRLLRPTVFPRRNAGAPARTTRRTWPQRGLTRVTTRLMRRLGSGPKATAAGTASAGAAPPSGPAAAPHRRSALGAFGRELVSALARSGVALCAFVTFLVGWVWLIIGIYVGGIVPWLLAAAFIGAAGAAAAARLRRPDTEQAGHSQ